MAGDDSLGLHSHRAEPMVSDPDLLELLDRVSLSGELSLNTSEAQCFMGA